MKGNYSNGKIYKILPMVEDANDNDIYYGSTVQLLCKRMDAHRSKYKAWKNGKHHKISVFDIFDKYGVDNCKIYLVLNYPSETKEQLESKEGEYIRNNKCVNRCIAGRTKDEYYKDNKDILAAKKVKYRIDNIERLSEYFKEYYQKNKEAIKQHIKSKSEILSEKHKCECGGCYTTKHKKKHFESHKHQNYILKLT